MRLVDAKAGATDLGEPDVIVDALFGTGFSGSPRDGAAELIDAHQREPGAGVRDRPPVGRRRVDRRGRRRRRPRRRDRDLPRPESRSRRRARPLSRRAGCTSPTSGSSTRTRRCVSRRRSCCARVPRRHEGDNKYTAGHVLVVGGSRGLTGAPSLVALAAMRADAGYVTVAVPASSLPVLEQRLLEAVKRPLAEDDGVVAASAADTVLELARKASSLAIGPGLGRGDGPTELVRRVARGGRAAGRRRCRRALRARAGEVGRAARADAARGRARATPRARVGRDRRAPARVGPGGGEALRLRRPAEGRRHARRRARRERDRRRRSGCRRSRPRGPATCSPASSAAFLAKGLEPQLAAAAAAVAQQRAAVEAPQRAGLVASDLIEALPRVLG